MKFSFKIFLTFSLLVSICIFSQIPVHKRTKPLKPRISKPKTDRSVTIMSSRDSIQKEILDVVSRYYNPNDDKENATPDDDQIMILRNKVNESKGLRKALYQYYLANIYVSYIARYGSRAIKKDITPLNELPEDYKTWAVNDFYRKADLLYSQSISYSEILKNEKTEHWNLLIDKVEFMKYKPTLYDLVATDYLKFLQGLPFDYDHMAKKKITEVKNNLYQFHANDDDKTAILYLKSTEIEGDVKKQSQQLEALADSYPKEPFSAYFLFQAANLAKQETSETNFLNAHNLCQKAINNIPSSDWSDHCKRLINELESSGLEINIPKRNLPGEYIPLETIYKNTDEVKVELSKKSGKIDFDKEPFWYRFSVTEKYISFINNQYDDHSFRSEIYSLKKFDDYKFHHTLLAIPPLEEGLYEISTSSKGSKNTEIFVVSDLFYVKRFEDDTKVTFQAMNTKTGKSIDNAEYIMYQNINEYEQKFSNRKENILIKTGKGNTNQVGMFSLPKSKDREYDGSIIYFPQLKKYFVIDRDYDEIKNIKEDEEQFQEPINKSFIIFTDRAIYRPGQKLFYKGILKQEYYEKTMILPKQKVTVTLMNPNYEKISKIEAVTNEFGSITGSFTLPPAGATGNYSIIMEADLGEIPGQKDRYLARESKSFNVEEYKRPKFHVAINPVKEAYKLGENVKVSGKAEAFSGADISGAVVKYEVKRQRIYFWRNYFDDYYYPNYNEKETDIAHGETTTDPNGNFNISFNAEVDKKSEKDKINYRYSVSFYVTDVNGESQSSQAVINIGDVKAKISIESSEQMLQNEWETLKISVSNLNDQKIGTKGNLTITKLPEENKILLPKFIKKDSYNRYRTEDLALKPLPYSYYHKELFDTYFPYLSYNQNPKSQKGELIFSKQFNTSETENITLNKNPEPGKYLVEATSVIDNDTVKTFKVIEVFDNITFRNGKPAYFGIRTDKESYKVGEKATVTFYSDFKEGFVNYRFIRNNKKEDYQQVAMKNGNANISFIVTDTDLKRMLYLDYDFIHDNDYAKGNIKFDIKENVNRNLEIITQVFRDKIQPGVPEKWVLTIKGKDKEKINAEVLASMYDASLDQFAKNEYSFSYYNPSSYDRYSNYDYYRWGRDEFFEELIAFESMSSSFSRDRYSMKLAQYPVPQLPSFQYTTIRVPEMAYYKTSAMEVASSVSDEAVVVGYKKKKTENTDPIYVVDGKLMDKNLPADEIANVKKLSPTEAAALYGSMASREIFIVTSKKAMKEELLKNVKARTNLDETAFFLPNLYTDSDGNIKLEFTSPEALTQWKLILFAHTKDLKTGSAEFFTKTQKELMVTPNPPRFLRQGDRIQVSAKIDNLSDKDLKGDIILYLFDPETSKPLDSAFLNTNSLKTINVVSKGSTQANWDIKIPYAVDHVGYKILAKTMNFSDGEENVLPILSDRMLVTETIPISIKEGQSKTYTMDGLVNNTSTSAANFNLSVELTSNPLWFAVMSVPYLRSFPHECSEQLFSRLYGNMLSTHIMNSSPKIKKIFDEWNAKETPSNPLESNENLKAILIGETPWLSRIKDQNEQMKELALFFNLNKMQRDLKKAQRDLVDRQNPDGSFSWFPGGGKDKTISGHILAGFGKLNKMLKGQSGDYFTNEINKVIKNSIDYLDKEYDEQLIKDQKENDKLDLNDYSAYFYYRSYWTQKEIPAGLKKVLNTLANTYVKDFDEYSLYHQAMITTLLQRYGYHDLAKKCVANLKKAAKTSEENGMYWDNNNSGWYWYQAPIETQSMLIEAFSEVSPEDVNSVEEMKVWLLKNKQTEGWGTTKSTTEAVYALLNYGKSWLDAEKGITMKLGSETIFPKDDGLKTSEAGFFKKSYYWKDITPEKGKLEIQKSSPGVAWGGMYRLYYENMDKVMAHNSSNVSIEKKLFLKTFNGNEGQLKEITPENPIKLGDLVTVRLVIRTDRDMQYIHLKDMRASGFEPVNVLSTYKWQNGTGYYESTRDAATHFFFNSLPKGTYVFEYELKANNIGDFSNGITSFQNMYAPAMGAHSEGIRVKIVK
ncbi:alpha-2-macroglobulin family protein [Chryseobacterium sp. M5A1_1a]